MSVGISYLHASRITMQKESTKLDKRFERYGLRRLNSNLTKFKFKQFKNVRFWFYGILLVSTSTQEKES